VVKITRGFRGKGANRDAQLPPGQHITGDFPVMLAEAAPHIDPATWTFAIDGKVDRPKTWTWDEIRALPASSYTGDIHCVTSWSKRGVTFAGVSVDTLLDAVGVKPEASHVLAFSHTGYTTNVTISDVTNGRAWVVWDYGGEPLERAHGGPARLLIPHLYFWKSAKFIAGLHILDHDEHGFWEQRGYHDRADPWLEQRYQGD
jgi:DMSO/TMAO reductase YedYZ molybdopterin-dependent catalytic subunit